MNAWLPPSRIRLWAARIVGAVGAWMATGSSAEAFAGGRLDAYVLRLGIDVLALWLCGKRRFRFAAALWFGCSAFFHLVQSVDRPSFTPPDGGLAAAAALSLTTILLVWPTLRAPNEQARLAPLSGAWVLVATLLLTSVDAVALGSLGTLPRDTAFMAGASAFALFAGCMLASQLGPLRWVGQLVVVGLIGAAQTAELGVFNNQKGPATDLASLVTWMGLATFALGLDWIRAGTGGRDRFLRAGGLSLAVSALPLALVAFWAPVTPGAMAIALARAAALGLAAAAMPRVAGAGRRVFRFNQPVGLPPWVLMVFVSGLLAAGSLLLAYKSEGEWVIGVAAAVPVLCCLLLRARFTRAVLFLMAGATLLLGAFGAAKSMGNSAVALAALAATGVLGYCITGPAAGRHFRRRLRWASVPAPRASLALAGSAVFGLASWITIGAIVRPETRPGLLASAGGSVPIPAALYFSPGTLRDAPSPGRLTGSTVAVDPLGRGTWVVDEERDEVALVGPDRQVKRFPVGEWPELLVITSQGRVFVSAREAARIDVIEPDFQRRAIEVDDEVRGLALDPEERHLYAGLILSRSLQSFDPDTLERRGQISLDADPRSVAVTAKGVATLPDKGSAVEFVSADLRRHWSVELPRGGPDEGVAWHGQALLPAGRDLLVLHARVNTGLDRPVSTGGYGGSVSSPMNLVATVIEGGKAPLIPPNARGQMGGNFLDMPDVAGAALGDGTLYLASRIRGQVERVPFGPNGALNPLDRIMVTGTELAQGNGLTGIALDGDRVLTYAAFDRVLVSTSLGINPPKAEPLKVETNLGAGRIDAQLARGRRLFFRNDGAISSAGLACASCHVDGREDGLVWRLQGHRLQTPSLAGRVADTAPYNWHGTTKTLTDNITQTVERLGGSGLNDPDRAALARYLSEGLRPVRAAPATGDAALVSRGKTLFHDRTVGCASCHDPDSGFTDGQAHNVESLTRAERDELKAATGKAPEAISAAFDTPTLRQVGLTAPYFHDGSAKTLEAVLEGNQDRMGKTSQLSADQRRALVAYLRTL